MEETPGLLCSSFYFVESSSPSFACGFYLTYSSVSRLKLIYFKVPLILAIDTGCLLGFLSCGLFWVVGAIFDLVISYYVMWGFVVVVFV